VIGREIVSVKLRKCITGQVCGVNTVKVKMFSMCDSPLC
jgi:hypothetical protein